jgi:hypothetical protein
MTVSIRRTRPNLSYIFSQLFFIRCLTRAPGATSSEKNRAQSREYDRERYKDQNLAERLRFKMKHYRRVATRYEITARGFLAFVSVASIMNFLWQQFDPICPAFVRTT